MPTLRPVLGAVVLVAVALGTVVAARDARGEGRREQAPAAAASTPELERRAVTLVIDLAEGRYPAVLAQFNARMQAAVNETQLRAVWAQLVSQAGPFTGQAAAKLDAPVTGARAVIVTCRFEQADVNLRVVFDAATEVTGFFVVPSAPPPAADPGPAPYATPSAFHEEEVTVGAGGAWPLPGTLTLPVGPGPFPAVVLVHGSGAPDRDETMGRIKPFRDLATGLASRGIAVLRYEKRIRQYQSRLVGLRTLTVKEETVEDAVAAVALLRADPRLDRSRVVVIGHSLGGMLVPRIAAADAGVAGFVVMAGATRPITVEIVRQLEYIAGLDGAIAPNERAQIDQMRQAGAAVDALTAADVATGPMLIGAPPSYWLDLRGYDPPAAAVAITRPLLVLQGERDYQVTMDDFGRWQAALATKPTATFLSYPGLNHGFVAGPVPSSPQDYEQPGHVAVTVIDDIATWIGRLR